MEIDVHKKPLRRQLVLTDREKVGVIIGAMALADRFVDFSYSLVVTVLSIQDHIAVSCSKREETSLERSKISLIILFWNVRVEGKM
ncbi:hypothetical protein L3X38_033242 [Prunus dulcis]|uniref:Uncharacterized protein n=1 Tax=Prunus dulcis TaxID=3755 RepID=A0AAD4VH01_PRUDU|nr:hypothetical protein L3X38_033242 [Prunus dulcis]